jgi:hypothetical protein
MKSTIYFALKCIKLIRLSKAIPIFLLIMLSINLFATEDYQYLTNADNKGISVKYRISNPMNKLININSNQISRIDGHKLISTPGYPKLIYKNIIFAVPLNSKPKVVLEYLDSGIYPVEIDVPPVENVVFDNITGENRTINERNRDIYETKEFFPKNCYELSEIGIFRGLRLVCLRIYPLQWNPVEEQLLINDEIEIRVDYETSCSVGKNYNDTIDVDPYFDSVKNSIIENYSTARYWSQETEDSFSNPSSWNPEGKIKLVIREKGLYRIYGSNLKELGLNLDSIKPSKIGLYNKAQKVAYSISTQEEVFGEDDYVEFYCVSYSDIFSNQNIYWLSFDEIEPLRISSVDASIKNFQAPLVETYIDDTKIEENPIYIQDIPNGDKIDHWYMYGTKAFTGEFKLSENLDIKNTTDSDFKGEIKIRVLGRTSLSNHLMKVNLNGGYIGETTWSGLTENDFIGTIDQRRILDGANSIEFDFNPGYTANDKIVINWIELTLEKKLSPENGYLFFSNEETGYKNFVLRGFDNENIRLFDISEPAKPLELTNYQIFSNEESFDLVFGYNIEKKTEFVAVANDKIKDVDSYTLPGTKNLKVKKPGADYIIITAPEFEDSLEPIISRHQNEGMRVLVATTDDIYDQFNYGFKSPVSIREFLKYCYYHYTKPAPSFVLLVGDANYDYKGNLGYKDYVPMYIYNISDGSGIINGLETSSDILYTSVSGEDDIPDMAIGRLPVNKVNQLETIINKMETYAKCDVDSGWNKNIIFAASVDEIFKQNSDILIEKIPEDYNPIPIYFSDTAKEDLIKNINNGALMVSFIGHGASYGWADGFFLGSDLLNLNNIDFLNLWTMYTCWNGLFQDPTKTCIAESVLLSDKGGGIVTLASSGLEYPNIQLDYGLTFIEQLFDVPMKRAGVAVLSTGILLGQYDRSCTEMIATRIFFGDPALALRNDFMVDKGLKMYVFCDKNEYNKGDQINLSIGSQNIGPDQDNIDIWAVVEFNHQYYFLPDGSNNPLKLNTNIPAGSLVMFLNMTFNSSLFDEGTTLKFYTEAVKTGTFEPVSNLGTFTISIE